MKILEHGTLSIVDRYFIAELAKVFAAIMATLVLIMTSMLFLRTLEQVDVGALASDAMLRFLYLQILRDLSSLLPPAFFLAALVTLGRMARDSELIAFAAVGFGPVSVYRSLLLFALPLALLTAWLALVMQPAASLEIQQIKALAEQKATQAAGLQAGRFYQQDDGRITFYASELSDDKRFRAIFIQDRRQSPTRIVLGETAEYRSQGAGLGSGSDSDNGQGPGRAVILEQGRRYDGDAGRHDYAIGDFERYTYFLPDEEAGAEQRQRLSSMPTAELIGASKLMLRAELGHRLAAPFSVLALALLAIPLTTLSPRQRSGGRMFLALLAYFAFFNLQGLAKNWMESGLTPPWLGMLWYQVLIIALVYLALVPGSFWSRRHRGRLWRRLGSRAGDQPSG
ncbi:LPS export ABC transporter permease LptF [Thiohalocapsa marina]|uniref:Lipopolysaccharide export system permease protein LptF n=1 Tax=Thiohalocapsa marina TaxID=424902 RepID=A0A5M8FSX1_9GAMM|nr:LPS export ABC transporter permease LptF [Thiohalocapsa marina]KAA6186262.1 LPS export ABC transporter permease LptF [Thiohalocapsa marina]